MFFTFEISRPIQWRPGFYRQKGVTTFRVWWLFFALALHPMREDEMTERVASGELIWEQGK